MTAAPARILGLAAGTLAPGAPADITLLDLKKAWTLDPRDFRTQGRNTPFGGKKVKGKAVATIVGGRVVYEA
jgi:dihydroorotase